MSNPLTLVGGRALYISWRGLEMIYITKIIHKTEASVFRSLAFLTVVGISAVFGNLVSPLQQRRVDLHDNNRCTIDYYKYVLLCGLAARHTLSPIAQYAG
jgi:hypothetical protein